MDQGFGEIFVVKVYMGD